MLATQKWEKEPNERWPSVALGAGQVGNLHTIEFSFARNAIWAYNNTNVSINQRQSGKSN
jgi:hypothetical protein